MKFFVITLAVVASAYAQIQYLPPVQDFDLESPVSEYLPPASEELVSPNILAEDGYRYKTVKRLRHRHRRDVSELNAEYLPPTAEASFPSSFDFAAAYPEEGGVLAADGYRYKAIKKLRHRNRRDVSELTAEYLPPVQEYSAQAAVFPAAPAPIDFSSAFIGSFGAAPETLVAEDGYRYKTVKKLRHRHRRDVSELNAEYLPPAFAAPAEFSSFAAPASFDFSAIAAAAVPAPVDVSAFASTVEFAPSHVLADDGYRYKAVKKYKVRRH